MHHPVAAMGSHTVCLLAALFLLLGPIPSHSFIMPSPREEARDRNLLEGRVAPRIAGLHPNVRHRASAKAQNHHVWMTLHEQVLIYSFLNAKKRASMLEWGSGGSSKHYAQFVEEYYSIEHSTGWYNEFKPTADTVTNLKYYLQAVEPGTGGWKGKFEEGSYKVFWHYVHGPEQIGKSSYDFILVDGRARVSCAVYALRLLHPHSYVFVHDFMPRRKYHSILKYYNIVATVDTLVVLQAKGEYLGKAIPESVLQSM